MEILLYNLALGCGWDRMGDRGCEREVPSELFQAVLGITQETEVFNLGLLNGQAT